MKSIFWALLLFFQLGWFQGISQKTINDPFAELRKTASFNAIVVDQSINLHLSMGSEPAVAISAPNANMRNQIKTEVRDNVLYISFKGKDAVFRDLKAYIAVSDLQKLTVSGSSNIRIEGELKVNDLEIILSGACDLKGVIMATNLKLTGENSSDFVLAGKVTNLKVHISGASDLKAFDLQSDYCEAEASGASDISITVNKELKVKISGASDLSYKGTAVLKVVEKRGATDIKKKDKK